MSFYLFTDSGICVVVPVVDIAHHVVVVRVLDLQTNLVDVKCRLTHKFRLISIASRMS